MTSPTPAGRRAGCLFLLACMAVTAVVLVGLALAAGR